MFNSARSYTFLSIGAAAATIVLKLAAFFALSLAAKPADREHPYGQHSPPGRMNTRHQEG